MVALPEPITGTSGSSNNARGARARRAQKKIGDILKLSVKSKIPTLLMDAARNDPEVAERLVRSAIGALLRERGIES